MSTRLFKGTLYVVMDFEGLGTRNSAEEDMLLSVFNAAISQLTVYKCEKVITNETRGMFDKFQNGVDKIRGDPKLFNGQLCMHVNSVQKSDMISVQQEFEHTIRTIIEETPT
eukprot:391109_1